MFDLVYYETLLEKKPNDKKNINNNIRNKNEVILLLFKLDRYMRKEDMKMFEAELAAKIGEQCVVLPPGVDVITNNNLAVITKHDFIINHISHSNGIDKAWESISKGYNFVLFDNNEGRYISIDYLNNLLGNSNG